MKTTTKKKKRTVADMLRSRLADNPPCKEALRWARKYTSPIKAWQECKEAEWLEWVIYDCLLIPSKELRNCKRVLDRLHWVWVNYDNPKENQAILDIVHRYFPKPPKLKPRKKNAL